MYSERKYTRKRGNMNKKSKIYKAESSRKNKSELEKYKN